MNAKQIFIAWAQQAEFDTAYDAQDEALEPIFDGIHYVPVGQTIDVEGHRQTDYNTSPPVISTNNFSHVLELEGAWYHTSCVHEEGGEGQGDHAEQVYAVLKFSEDISSMTKATATVVGYVQWVGFYSSYNGTEWDLIDDVTAVIPNHYTALNYVPVDTNV